MASVRSSTVGRGLALAALALLGAAAACDVPTAVPHWNQSWVVPAESTTVAVAELLPPGVRDTTIGGARVFALSLGGPVSIRETLGDACPDCAAANGMRAPKPAFQLADSTTIALPADLVSADVTGGSVAYTIVNGLSFDPLRPSAAGAPYGHLVIRVRNGATTIATDSLDGATSAIAAHDSLTRSLALGAFALDAAQPITVSLALVSPQGDTVMIDTSESFALRATPGTVTLARARVRVQSQAIDGVQQSLDLSGVTSSSVVNRVQGGALRLTVDNPFGVGGTVDVRLAAPNATPIAKRIDLPATPERTTQSVPLSADELRSLLGQNPVTVDVSGTVSAPSGAVTVEPGQELRAKAELELTLSTTEG